MHIRGIICAVRKVSLGHTAMFIAGHYGGPTALKKKSYKFVLFLKKTYNVGQKKTTVRRPIGGLVFFVRPIVERTSCTSVETEELAES